MTFVAIDGPTASGKSTLIKNLEEKLITKNISYSILDERNKIRNIMEVFHENDLIRSELPALTESTLWIANQLFRIETQIIPSKSEFLLVDRYIYTPIVYQYLALKDKGIKLENIVEFVSNPFGIRLPIPNVSLILLSTINVIEERFYKRERREMKKSERESTKTAIELYKSLESYFDNYYIIDSNESEEKILDAAKKICLL